jgi:hypothetical protein
MLTRCHVALVSSYSHFCRSKQVKTERVKLISNDFFLDHVDLARRLSPELCEDLAYWFKFHQCNYVIEKSQMTEVNPPPHFDRSVQRIGNTWHIPGGETLLVFAPRAEPFTPVRHVERANLTHRPKLPSPSSELYCLCAGSCKCLSYSAHLLLHFNTLLCLLLVLFGNLLGPTKWLCARPNSTG